MEPLVITSEGERRRPCARCGIAPTPTPDATERGSARSRSLRRRTFALHSYGAIRGCPPVAVAASSAQSTNYTTAFRRGSSPCLSEGRGPASGVRGAGLSRARIPSFPPIIHLLALPRSKIRTGRGRGKTVAHETPPSRSDTSILRGLRPTVDTQCSGVRNVGAVVNGSCRGTGGSSVLYPRDSTLQLNLPNCNYPTNSLLPPHISSPTTHRAPLLPSPSRV